MKRVLFAASLAACACTLDEFEKSDSLCGMPASTSASCLACIAASRCCAETKSCADNERCAPSLGKPVTPVALFDDSFNDALSCLQQKCDEVCGISWGCTSGYQVDLPTTLSSTIQVRDSANEQATTALEVRGCRGTDPLCRTGVLLGTTDTNGSVKLGADATYADSFAITQPGADPADLNSYAPTHTRWSELVTWVEPAATYVFQREQVRDLVTVSQGAAAYDPMQSHLVFFAHNCLPIRYAFQGLGPVAQAAGVTIRLEPDASQYPIVYTNADALPDRTLTATSPVGSGGAVGIPSELNLTVIGLRNGVEYAQSWINAAPGGVGVVHLVPAAQGTVR